MEVEGSLLASGFMSLVGLDEVGRGAVAGPVSVGAVLVDRTTSLTPPPVRDSKLLSARARDAALPQIGRWARASAVGHASAAEIDRDGIVAALRLAGLRALAQLPQHPDVVLLDGNLDWLSDPDVSESDPHGAGLHEPPPGGLYPDRVTLGGVRTPVVTRVKADRDCASVAAASVVAKTARDQILTELAVTFPGYGLERHKGYLTAAHADAISRLGACDVHRRSWRLPPGP
jgi:ribonuclease HII